MGLDAHRFIQYSDGGFKAMKSAGGAGGATTAKARKIKPNESCTCGSGKKAKKCGCGAYTA